MPKLTEIEALVKVSAAHSKAILHLLVEKGIFTREELKQKTMELAGLNEAEFKETLDIVFETSPPKPKGPGSASDDVSTAYDCLTNARFKLEAEKKGMAGALALKACTSIDAIKNSLRKMTVDLRHAGF